MVHENEVIATDRRFLAALSSNDPKGIASFLDRDFILIDVMTGSEVVGSDFLELIGSRRLVFEPVEHLDVRERRYGTAAIITGRTRMRGSYEGRKFDVGSRYTHVYAQRDGGWLLVAAQGTPIAADAATGDGRA